MNQNSKPGFISFTSKCENYGCLSIDDCLWKNYAAVLIRWTKWTKAGPVSMHIQFSCKPWWLKEAGLQKQPCITVTFTPVCLCERRNYDLAHYPTIELMKNNAFSIAPDFIEHGEQKCKSVLVQLYLVCTMRGIKLNKKFAYLFMCYSRLFA